MNLKKSLARTTAFVFFSLSAFSVPALALAEIPQRADGEETPASVSIAPIMVTATRVEADLREIPMSVSVVNKTEIEEHPSPEVADHFTNVPGASFSAGKSGAGNNAMISLRGLEAGRVLYLIDGVRQNSVFKEDMNKGLMNVDPEDIERIEVIKGPASSLYGSDAIGGVINIITKKGGDGKPIGFRAGLDLDSSTMGIGGRGAVYGDYNGFSYRFSGSGVNANDRRLAQGGKADHSSYTTQSLSGQLGYEWDGGSLNFTAQYYDSDVAEMSSIFDFSDLRMILYDMDDPQVYYLSDFPKNRRNTYTGKLELNDLTDNFTKFTLTAFYQQRDTVQQGISNDGTTNNDSWLQDMADLSGLTMQTDWLFFDSHLVTAGAEFLYDDLRNKAINAYDPNTYFYTGSQQTMAMFVQDEWNFAEGWAVTGGLRQSWTISKIDRNDKNPEFTDSANNSSLVGNLGLVYTGLDNYAFRLQYSQGYRVPDIGSQFTGAGIYLVPNQDLKPEKSYTYEAGVRYNDENLDIDASIFYSKIDDMMTTKVLYYIPNTTWSVNQTVNAATYESYGFELAAAWRIPGTGFTPYGNLTLLHTKLDHGWYSTEDNRVPEAWGTVGVKWEHDIQEKTRLFTDLSYRLADNYKFDGGSDAIWYEHKAGQQLDFSIGLEHKDENGHKMKGVLALKNILNQEYEPEYYYYPGFSAVLSLHYEF